MRKGLKIILVAGSMMAAPAAMAAPVITGVTVTGATSNFTWSTAPKSGKDTLFVAHGSTPDVGPIVNPNNAFSNTQLGNLDAYGDYNFTFYGDGYGSIVVGNKGKILSAPNSDASYLVSVMIKDGNKMGTLTGTYTLLGNTFVSTGAAFVGNTDVYQIDTFDWGRQLADYVGRNSTSTSGSVGASRADYRGDLALSATAVPEPATWAMMMLGFGMIGFGLRRRSKVNTSVRFA